MVSCMTNPRTLRNRKKEVSEKIAERDHQARLSAARFEEYKHRWAIINGAAEDNNQHVKAYCAWRGIDPTSRHLSEICHVMMTADYYTWHVYTRTLKAEVSELRDNFMAYSQAFRREAVRGTRMGPQGPVPIEINTAPQWLTYAVWGLILFTILIAINK